MAKSRLNISDSPLEIGDMVARRVYYSNGKPKRREDYDYTKDEVGIVISQRYNPSFGEDIIIVNFGGKEGHYIKSTSASFLIKLS